MTANPGDPQTVTLAPAQFDRVDTLGSTAVFAVGVLVIALVALLVWALSRPGMFGVRGVGRFGR